MNLIAYPLSMIWGNHIMVDANIQNRDCIYKLALYNLHNDLEEISIEFWFLISFSVQRVVIGIHACICMSLCCSNNLFSL